jgi:hypothetical protein
VASPRLHAFVFAGWTLFMWATRIRNAVTDDELSTGAKVWAVGVATAFTLGGLAVLVSALRRQHLTPVVRVVAAITIVFWPIRVVQIAFNDHDAAFVVVHAVLGIVSVSLALWAWSRTVIGRPRKATAGVAV